MRTLVTLSGLTLASLLSAQSISTQGFSFSPDLLTVQAGADIALTIDGGHTMTEVSEATWNANGNSSNGGFNFSAGNHNLNLTDPGTYYYVCQPHAGMGMKGRIIVTGTGVNEAGAQDILTIAPNPANESIRITFPSSAGTTLHIIDMQGREMRNVRLGGNDVISVADLSKGNYTVVVMDANGRQLARRPLSITR